MKQCREEPYMQSQFWQEPILSKENHDTVVCISLNEYIVDMIYNIASNT